MEKNSNQDKKKIIITLVVGAVTLLVAIVGATYAYFQVNTTNNNTNSNVTVKTGKPGTATLKSGVSDLHIILNNSDMSLTNANKEYYADDTKNYVENETEGIHTISNVEITDGDSDISYKCTASVEVSLTTSAGSMGEALKVGDVLLNVEGQEIDLYNVKESNPTTVNLNFNIIGNNTKKINAYAKLINKKESQNYLSGRQLKVNITSKNLDCEVIVPDPKIAFLRSKDSQGYLSSTIQGDMYRYQAAPASADEATQMGNWICFGTTENCGTNDELIDKYMYRIIGITPEGEMKLIKETFLKEENVTGFAWNSQYILSNCLGNTCEWANVDLFKRLNGAESNGNPIFINSSEYEYMAQGTKWYNLIEEHNWMYGDTNEIKYNANEMYLIELGDTATKRYWPDVGQETCSSNSPCTEKEYIWFKRVPAKIGLMYLHDLDYAYTGENPESGPNIKNSWLHFQKDGYNTSPAFEWLLTRYGGYFSEYYIGALFVGIYGNSGSNHSYLASGVRPVFFLSSDVTIQEGTDGTKTNPYILDIEE